MARTARKTSQMNIYHVMLRGVNRQQIFYDVEDFRHFEKLLAHYKPICGYKLYAYCLMGNHIHLLMRTGAEPLGTTIKRIGCSFVYWYNAKYERVGHLFQGRYRSEPINTEHSFLSVLRYILQNPVKAGLCGFPEEYPYSSGKEYAFSLNGITDQDIVLDTMAREELREFIHLENDDQFIEDVRPGRRRCTDKMAKGLILKEFGTFSPAAGDAKDRKAFSISLRKLYAQGISIRQLSRLTGISKKVIERGVKNK